MSEPSRRSASPSSSKALPAPCACPRRVWESTRGRSSPSSASLRERSRGSSPSKPSSDPRLFGKREEYDDLKEAIEPVQGKITVRAGPNTEEQFERSNIRPVSSRGH